MDMDDLPTPERLALVPADQQRQLLDHTEHIVEDYYGESGFDCPEYSYLMLNARIKPRLSETHAVLS